MMKYYEAHFNEKGKKEKYSERGEIIYDPVISSQGQFCMIIIRLLKTLKLILANTTWFKYYRTGIITVEKMVLKVIS